MSALDFPLRQEEQSVGPQAIDAMVSVAEEKVPVSEITLILLGEAHEGRLAADLTLGVERRLD